MFIPSLILLSANPIEICPFSLLPKNFYTLFFGGGGGGGLGVYDQVNVISANQSLVQTFIKLRLKCETALKYVKRTTPVGKFE